MSSIKLQLADDIKSAMRAKDALQLTTLRLVSAAIKQKEVDDRIELDDAAVVAVIEKMVKQRKDAIEQFAAGGRQDLVDKESAELQILTAYLPAQLSASEIAAIIDQAVGQLAGQGVTGPAAMGKVMGLVKPQLAGRADMGQVSRLIKDRLS
ncbi:MAG: hypothetical protein RL483_1088 [Pseudomonadota bacterium]